MELDPNLGTNFRSTENCSVIIWENFQWTPISGLNSINQIPPSFDLSTVIHLHCSLQLRSFIYIAYPVISAVSSFKLILSHFFSFPFSSKCVLLLKKAPISL
ncbi:hypothetical protein LINPERPRIM_LOCUS37322 [Linum perenne]